MTTHGTGCTLELIAIGDELLNGQVVDTNSAWLGNEVGRLGLTVRRRQVVADAFADIAAALALAASRSDVVVVSGGLGPTVDDMTAEATARWLGVDWVLHETALAQVQARYAWAGRGTRPIDEKQARLPATATVLENPVGTAPAFSVTQGSCLLFFFPGVPHEYKTLSTRYALPELGRRAGTAPTVRTWKLFGTTESGLAHLVDGLDPAGLALHYRAHFPEIHLTVVAAQAAQAANVAAFAERFERELGAYIFGDGDARLPAVVNALLQAGGHSLATAESCTGGLLGQLITSEPGSSAVYLGGFIAYANAAKTQWVGVPDALLEAHGAVSEPVALALAQGARTRSGATFGLGVTGIAGPGGGTPDKPVGTVHVALATPDGTHHRKVHFRWDRERIRLVTATLALDMLRRHLQGHAVIAEMRR